MRSRPRRGVPSDVAVQFQQGHRRGFGARRGCVRGSLHRGRHHACRPDAGDRGAAGGRRRHQRAALPGHRTRIRPAARRIPGAHVRTRRSSRRAQAVPGDRRGVGAQRIGSATEHGLHRRQPHATATMLVLPRCDGGVQPANTGSRLFGDRRPQPYARHPWHQRPVRRHPSVGSRCRAGGTGRPCHHARQQRGTPDPDIGVLPPGPEPPPTGSTTCGRVSSSSRSRWRSGPNRSGRAT